MNGDVAWMPGTRQPVTAVGDVAEGKMAVFADATGRKVRAQDVPTPQPVSHFVEAVWTSEFFGQCLVVDCSGWTNGEHYLIAGGNGFAGELAVVFKNLPDGIFSFGFHCLIAHSKAVFGLWNGDPSVMPTIVATLEDERGGEFYRGILHGGLPLGNACAIAPFA